MAVREGMTETEMILENPRAWNKACDMVARIERGDKILDHNLFHCIAHPENMPCGQTVEIVEWDEGGPMWRQPEGFICDGCERYCCNAHGHAKIGLCNQCAEDAR